MKEIDISYTLLDRLESYGAIKWHKTAGHSFYIKFRDVRLGSIRIANHRGREKYHYTYEIFVNDQDIERKIEEIVEGVSMKAKWIVRFDPKKFIVFDTDSRQYVEVESFKEYKNHILKKEQ